MPPEGVPDDYVFVRPIGPPVLPGDFNGDGVLDEDDPANWWPPEPEPPAYGEWEQGVGGTPSKYRGYQLWFRRYDNDPNMGGVTTWEFKIVDLASPTGPYTSLGGAVNAAKTRIDAHEAEEPWEYEPDAPEEWINIHGLENGAKANILNVAGYVLVGVGQGTVFMLIPILAVSVAVGFMKRVVQLGTSIGDG